MFEASGETYAFMIKKDIANYKLFESEKDNYVPSLLSDEYLHEKIFSHYSNDTLNVLKQIDKNIKSEIADKLSENKNFTIHHHINNIDYLISFISTKNIEGNPAAYMISYYKDKSIISGYQRQNIVRHISSFILILIIVFVILFMSLKKGQIINIPSEYEDILDANSDIVYMTNYEGKFLYCNKQIEKFLDYKIDEVVGKMLFSFFSENNDYQSKYIDLFQKGRTISFELFALHKNGSQIPVEVAAKIINFKDQKVAVGTIRDITKRKKAELALAESEEKYRLITENVSDVIWIFNISKNKFTYISPSEYNLTGYTAEESVIQSVREKFTQESAKRAEEAIKVETQKFIENPNNNAFQVNILQQKCKNVSLVWIETTSNLRYNSANEIEIVGTTRNIEDRIKAEIDLKESEAKLRESNKTKDKFFSIIAHDLKSPFNAIIGFSEILLENHKNYDDTKREQIINLVNKSANNAFNLLENLLTWSRSQSGNVSYLPEKVYLRILLFETINILQTQADKKNISISDRNMIATVFRNLISNAIKYTHKNGSIVISSKIQQENNFIEISVMDTGVGIPKDKIDDLFRLDKDMLSKGTENESGTGLGLVLCKEFVEKHGGKIWVKSEVNKGSNFIFTLPINY